MKKYKTQIIILALLSLLMIWIFGWFILILQIMAVATIVYFIYKFSLKAKKWKK